MHILIIPSWYPLNLDDISGSFFREQALALQKNGCKVGVIYPQLRSLRDWKSIASGQCGVTCEIDNGMPTYRSHGTNWFPRIPNANSWLWIKHGITLYNKYINDHGKPDIIHVHSALYGGGLAKYINKKDNISYVITEHLSGYLRGLISKPEMVLTKKSTEFSSKNLAVSRSLCRQMEKSLGTPPNSWHEIPNIVHDSFINYKAAKKTKNGDFNFICVALLSENKCIHNAIQAFAVAFKKNNNIMLTIGGDGPERARLEKLSNDLGLTSKIQFLGLLGRNQVLEEISKADAFILPSRHETFGVVATEALALGKPIIATRCGGPESIVEEGDGILVPVDDIQSLADAMLSLQNNIVSYNPEKIRQSCIARFSETAVATRLKMIYKEILAKK
jgi:glycosyltransferase involved in cell wall biosynthesis